MQINSKHPLYRLARDTYPEYTGRRVFVQATHEISFYDLNWSGGTKRTYTIVRLDGKGMLTNDTVDGFDAAHPAHNRYEGKTVPMDPNYLVIVRSWFCGREAGITVYTYAPAPLAPAQARMQPADHDPAARLPTRGRIVSTPTLEGDGPMRTAPRKPKVWNYDNFQQRYLAFYAATKRRYARALARGRSIIEPTGSIWSITDTTSAVYGFLPEFRTPEYIAAHLANRAQGFGWYQANRVH